MQAFIRLLSCLAVLARLSLAQDPSQHFSQYIGAPTAAATFQGASASQQSESLAICTNYIHGLPATSNLPSSLAAQLGQQVADAVCQFCTSLQQTRVDSCCAQATSVDCFEKFGRTPAAGAATPTTAAPVATAATATGGATQPTSKSGSDGGMITANTDILAGSFVVAVLGFIGWAL